MAGDVNILMVSPQALRATVEHTTVKLQAIADSAFGTVQLTVQYVSIN
jgi:hypothetical protein